MSFQTLERNLGILGRVNPALADRVRNTPVPDSHRFETSKSGKPVLRIGNVLVHSAYRPEEESEKFYREHSTEGEGSVVVFGIGFGYHLHRLAKDGTRTVHVIEPELGTVRALFEHVECGDWLDKVRLHEMDDMTSLVPSDGLKPFFRELDVDRTRVAVHRPSAQCFPARFELFQKQWSAKSILQKNTFKILVVGPASGGSLPTARHAVQALRNLGHDVAYADVSRFDDSYRNIGGVTRNPVHLSQLKSLYVNFMGEAVAAAADDVRPDLIVALAQAPLAPRGIERLKVLGVPIAFWFVEDFRTLKYWESVAPLYDYFFTIQRGEFFDRLRSMGVKRCAYLPQACGPEVHAPLSLTPEEMEKYGSDLSFMGAGYRNRKEFFKGLLDFDFSIWGTEWDLFTPVGLRVKNQNRRLDPEEYVKIFNASKINLNLHSSTYLDGVDPLGDFVNPRTFEIASCGAFQLVDYRSELPCLFKEGEEVIGFQTLEEAREKIHTYLKDPEKRTEIAGRGRRRALAEHTFEHRMADMLHLILTYDGERILRKKEKEIGPNHVGRLLEEIGDDAELRAFLKPFEGEGNLRLSSVMKQIGRGKGALTRPESIFIMLNEIVTEGQG